MDERTLVFLAERIEQCLADDYVPVILDKEEATLALEAIRKYLDYKQRDGKDDATS